MQLLSLVALLGSVALALAVPEACRCSALTLNTTLETQYYKDARNGIPFAKVRPMAAKVSADGTRVKYHLYVEQMYADCVEGLPRIQLLYTGAGPCGVKLKKAREYIIPLRQDARSTKLSICNKFYALSDLSDKQRTFLWTRATRSCEGRLQCGWGQMPYSCGRVLRRRPAKPCHRAKRWSINECDGCKAEWFTWSGLPACEGVPSIVPPPAAHEDALPPPVEAVQESAAGESEEQAKIDVRGAKDDAHGESVEKDTGNSAAGVQSALNAAVAEEKKPDVVRAEVGSAALTGNVAGAAQPALRNVGSAAPAGLANAAGAAPAGLANAAGAPPRPLGSVGGGAALIGSSVTSRT